MMRKLLIGAIVPLTASLGLWLGLGSTVAQARTVSAPVRTAIVRTLNESNSATAPDADNIQQGDQTSPDTSTVQSDTAGKSGNESQTGNGQGENNGEGESQGENEGNNDGPGGHQDGPGNVNYECTGDCQQ